MKNNGTKKWLILITIAVLASFASLPAAAQVLAGEQLKKAVPSTFFFSGQVATVQARNSAALKNSAGKLVVAGLVDTSGYATAIAERFQGFLITEARVTFDSATLEPGAYGFGFKDGKFTVMNVAGTDLFSVAGQSDPQLKHPVPLKLEKSDAGYRLYAGRNYVVVKAE